MESNYLGSYAPSLTHKWTKQAYDCYKMGCNCIKCYIPQQMISQECQMKATIFELIKNVGIPTQQNCTSWSFKGIFRKKDLGVDLK